MELVAAMAKYALKAVAVEARLRQGAVV